MFRLLHAKRFWLGNSRGFALSDMTVAVAVIAVLAAIAFPLYADVRRGARIAKVKADIRTITSSVSMYAAHVGLNPPALADLTTQARNSLDQVAGPFLAAVPTAPEGWTAYEYVHDGAGAFVVSSTGDDTTVVGPDEAIAARRGIEAREAPRTARPDVGR